MQRVKPGSGLRKFLRLALIGFGAVTLLSAVVNATAAWQLIELAEEQSLGISRGEFVGTYGVIALIGAALIATGLRWRN